MQDSGVNIELEGLKIISIDFSDVFFTPPDSLSWKRPVTIGRLGLSDRSKGQQQKRRLKKDGQTLVKLHLPFVSKKEIDLSKIGDELIIKIGNFKKNIVLPRAYALLEPKGARLEEDHLWIDFGGSSE